MRDNFPKATIQKLAERAGFICSNPLCRRITIGPSLRDDQKSVKTGIAAHICAASPKGPRYDMSQSKSERESIKNAIWLCSSCAALIDKNNGIDYPGDHLRKWKKDHEILIKECLEGNKRFTLQFIASSDQTEKCRSIIKFLEQRGALFMAYKYEVSYFVFDSIKEIRTFLTQMSTTIEPDSPLEIIVDSMNHACRHFMNTTYPSMPMIELAYDLGALRKIIGINLLDMNRLYDIEIKGQLKEILPIE